MQYQYLASEYSKWNVTHNALYLNALIFEDIENLKPNDLEISQQISDKRRVLFGLAMGNYFTYYK